MMRLLIILAVGVLASCAGAADPPVAAPSTGLPFAELPAQTLSKGQCGLFLWARTEPPQRVFMALSAPALARVRMGGRTIDAPRVSYEGEAAFGHYAEQRFAAPGLALTARIEMQARGALVSGAVVPSGTLTYEDAAGESTVLPVAGLVACES